MHLMKRLTTTVFAGLVALPVMAGDYDDVLRAVKMAWPDRSTGAAICSVDFNQLALLDLTDSAKNLNLNLIIVNVQKPVSQKREGHALLRKSLSALLARKPGFLVLIDDDPMLGAKSGNTGFIVSQAAAYDIPTVAITREAMEVGAIFSIGPGTDGKLLTNRKVAERMKLPLPDDVAAVEIDAPK